MRTAIRPTIAAFGLAILNLSTVVVEAQFNYTTTNGTVTITGYTGSGGVVTIPEKINGLPVTTIGYEAFLDWHSLNSVTIPNSVTNIGDWAFGGCTNLAKVTIGTNVTRIGEGSFGGCTSLANVTIGSRVITIGNLAFEQCSSLASVTIPNSVTSIGDYAFSYCPSLTNVTIGTHVTSIGDRAFGACTSLTAITVDALNSNYSSVNGVLFDKSQTTLIAYPEGKAGSYTIRNSVTNIGDWAFGGCTNLTSVTIGTNVTRIGEGSFGGCTSLANVTIGSRVITIGDLAFQQCSSLASVTIPNSVSSIGGYAFSYCPRLTNVTIGTGVTSIGTYAFYDCTSLTRVYFAGIAPSFGAVVFGGDWLNMDPATIYYLPGTTGWNEVTNETGLPVVLWPPQVQTINASFGVRTNQFGFTIEWAGGMTVVVEASTNVVNPVWIPLATNTLTGGSSYFSDPQWRKYPARFYRIRIE